MKIKTNRYGFFSRKSNGTWCGPIDGSTFTMPDIDGMPGGKKAVVAGLRRMTHRKVKLLRQVWVS